MKTILFIAGGSAAGGVLRYLMGGFLTRTMGGALPWGTFLVNILGCLLLGFLMTKFASQSHLPEEYKLALTVGLCGGFTTFSTFAHENFVHLQQGNWLHLLIYAGLSFIVGVIAIFCGYWLAR